MDTFALLIDGFGTALSVTNLLWALFGCALGTAVGVLPGIGPATTVAMLLPITTKVDITASMIFFAGIYYGAMYGGSTTSILLNTPGETASLVTAMEGNKMAKSGRAGQALATAAIGSFVAGTIATVVVTLFAPVLADYAVKLGPPEYFLLMVLAFTTVSAVLGKSTVRGLAALFVGLAIGLIGMDQISGQPRYTGGKPEFLDGIEIVLVAVGLFAVAEVLHAARWLHDATDGVFDVSLGSGARGWRCDGERLERLAPVATLDLGGIAKGYAVDVAVEALRRHGCESGWVNAGGDLRVFGDARVPVMLRDEAHGGVRPFATVADAALASSHFGPQSRSRAWGLDRGARACCVSVAAPRCVWADALTKVVAVSGDARHRALGACGAHAWLH